MAAAIAAWAIPMAIPRIAVTHRLAATGKLFLSLFSAIHIRPVPRKPSAVIICAARRPGSAIRGKSKSLKNSTEVMVTKAEPNAIKIKTRMLLAQLKKPMINPTKTAAPILTSASAIILQHPVIGSLFGYRNIMGVAFRQSGIGYFNESALRFHGGNIFHAAVTHPRSQTAYQLKNCL